ncbi:MAG: glycoside hydrolase family 2 TIM barrel-domain containing protein [Lachnospiraceae bacterium]
MRREYNMNFDWKFYDGDILNTNFRSVHDIFENPSFMKSANCGISKAGYDTSEWETVQIPHDFRIARGVFDQTVPSSQGFLSTGIVWYHKEFFIDACEDGNSIILQFDGIFRDSEIYVNGTYVANHLSGYTGITLDVSDFILYGENNAIAVRVDATKFEGWWYEGGGIYRDVRMFITGDVRVKEDGVFITSTPTDTSASVTVSVELENQSEKSGDATLHCVVTDPNGVIVKELDHIVEVVPYEGLETTFSFDLENIMRWDIDAPHQYKADFTVSFDGITLDSYTQKFGIREVMVTAKKGVMLNGRQVKIHGVCVHDDFAGVGTGMSRAVIRHKIFLLKEMGCTGYRTSHNPPSPYLLEACDDFGILVMDEVRMMSTSDEFLSQMTDMMKRDRNHPCIFIWSIGNEEMGIHGTKLGVKIGNHLLRVAHKLDSTRPCTYANNCDWREITVFHEENGLHMDVIGLNYYCLRTFDSYEFIHSRYPDKAIIGTENGSAISTRGQFVRREEEQNLDIYSKREEGIIIWDNPDRKYHVSEYADSFTKWGTTPMETLRQGDPDHIAGYFTWTGFDYRGETFPFDWPSAITRFGIRDLCGFLKCTGHQYRVKWTKEPAIFMYPHWTFDKDMGEVEVRIVSNTEEVEFIINGVSHGRVPSPHRDQVCYFVDYEPGEITAIGYNDGKEVTRIAYQTAGEPVSINLEVLQDREYIAGCEDNVFVKVEVLDANGIHCPNANNFIEFEVAGAGSFKGAGNGDPLSHEHDLAPNRYLFNGLALAILQTGEETGTMTLTATSKDLTSASVEINVTKPCTYTKIADAKEEIELAEIVKDAADGAF